MEYGIWNMEKPSGSVDFSICHLPFSIQAGIFQRPAKAGSRVRVHSRPAAAVAFALLLSGCASRALVGRPVSSTGATIEGTDQRLAAALLLEAARPSADTHLQVAREYARLGILDAAHSRTKRALARNPRSPVAHEFMARIWRDWGMPESGLPFAHRAVSLDQKSASAHNTLATILDALGQVEAARSAYEHALVLDPQAGWALNNLCYLELRLGRLEQAARRCEAAVRASPALAAAHNNLGLTYAAAGDMRRAGDAFREGGGDAAAHYNVGMVHLASRRYAEAALAFEEAVKLRPDFTAAKTRAHQAHMRALTDRARK
jgi:tetratricopeptide (TPR) repeat protein